MKEKKLFAFSALATELGMSLAELAESIKSADLPKPSIINRVTGELFFKDESEYQKVRAGLETSPLSEEEFLALFEPKKGKRGRPKKSAAIKKSVKKSSKKTISKTDVSAENTGKRRGRPPKAK